MAIIIPDNNQPGVGAHLPAGAVDATEFSRVGPLVTPEEIETEWLFGIPLYIVQRDPLTRKASVLRFDSTKIKKQIEKAVNRMEFKAGLSVFPVAKKQRLAFDRNDYLNLGYFQLPDRPILSVQALTIRTAKGDGIYRVPNEWISPGHLRIGQINVIPLQPAFLSSGFVPSQSAGGAAFLVILGQHGWIPEYWEVEYISGFEEGKVPRVVNDLIAIETSISILSILAATNRSGSHSISIDGISQSVSTPGPEVYKARIEDLREEQKVLLGRLRAFYALNLFSTAI